MSGADPLMGDMEPNQYEMSIEELSIEIRVALAKKGLKAKDLADEMQKSRQWISALMNPNQLKNRQIEALKVIEEMK